MPKVTMIPATINPKTRLPEMIRAKKTGGRLRSCFHGQRRAVHQLCSADGVLHKPDQRQSGLGICPRLYGRGCNNRTKNIKAQKVLKIRRF